MSTSDNPSEVTNKRAVGNTSFDQVSLSPESGVPESKRFNSESDSSSSKLVTEEFITNLIQTTFDRFEKKIDLRFANIDARLDALNSRLGIIEHDASSRDIRITNVLSRVDELEQRGADVEQRLVSVESSGSGVSAFLRRLRVSGGRLAPRIPTFCFWVTKTPAER